jgi:ketosteroid isomerase-like protein
MAVTTDQGIIERYYRAMEAGSPERMDTLFTDDAVYREPFSKGGELTTHTGRPEIVGWLGASFEQGNKSVTITLDRLDVDGDTVVAEWTCVGPMLPGPMKGHDRYRVRDGRIAELETRLGPAH